MMVCETEQAILDAAAANYDAVLVLKQANADEAMQIQMQEMAAMGQAMMAWWLVQSCLQNSGNGPMAVSPEESESLRLGVPSASELVEFQREILPGILESRKTGKSTSNK